MSSAFAIVIIIVTAPKNQNGKLWNEKVKESNGFHECLPNTSSLDLVRRKDFFGGFGLSSECFRFRPAQLKFEAKLSVKSSFKT